MDSDVLETLRNAEMDPEEETWLPSALPADDEEDRQGPEPGPCLVSDGSHHAQVRLKPVSELFSGDHEPPSFTDRPPPPRYVPFFATIELAAARYCARAGDTLRDKEYEEIYSDLRRRPDGQGRYAISEHIQCAIRLYMSVRDVSRAEYDAVLRRLTRSARTFAMGYTSMNYTENVLDPLLGRGG